MHTLARAKNNVQRPQKGSLPEVSVGDCTKWFDSQPVWPSWLVKEMYYIVFVCQTRTGSSWYLCETTSHLKYEFFFPRRYLYQNRVLWDKSFSSPLQVYICCLCMKTLHNMHFTFEICISQQLNNSNLPCVNTHCSGREAQSFTGNLGWETAMAKTECYPLTKPSFGCYTWYFLPCLECQASIFSFPFFQISCSPQFLTVPKLWRRLWRHCAVDFQHGAQSVH